jgi:osmotically inducible lipoprotein OsmB
MTSLVETDMHQDSLILAVALSLPLLQGCENLTAEQRIVVGVTAGAAAGLITAEALDADDDWRLIAALAGAAAGTMVAQNTATGQCAYSRGDGTYFTAPCP